MIKKIMITMLLLIMTTAISVSAAPEYARWGKIAVLETQKKYNVDIIDYKHLGRTELTAKKYEEKFKLWVRSKQKREFAVYVFIQFDPITEDLQSISFSENSQ